MVKIWHFTPILIANLTLGLPSTWFELVLECQKHLWFFLVQGLRAERRIGEFSRDLPKNYGRYQQTSHDGESDKTSILKEAGITHCERYEAIASLPDEVLERHIQAETCPRINGDGV